MRYARHRLTPEQWAQVQALFHATIDLTPKQQREYLDKHCADRALRDEVEALLRTDRTGRGAIRQAIEREANDLLGAGDASGERFGVWRLLRPLQHGGMGAVYLAERADDEYRKQVAVKLLRNALVTEEERQRFRTERQILADLEHPHIARLIDGGTRPTARLTWRWSWSTGSRSTAIAMNGGYRSRSAWSCSGRYAWRSTMHTASASSTAISSPATSSSPPTEPRSSSTSVSPSCSIRGPGRGSTPSRAPGSGG